MKRTIIFLFYIFAISSFGGNEDSAVESLRMALAIEDNPKMMRETVRRLAETSRMTRDEFSDALQRIAVDSVGPMGEHNPFVSRCAMRFLAEYGTTNALLALGEIVLHPEGEKRLMGLRQDVAFDAFSSLDGSGVRTVRLLEKVFAPANVPYGDVSLLYQRLDANALPENRVLVNDFILSRALSETNQPHIVDDILCRRIKGYDTSTHRLAAARFALCNGNMRWHSHFSNVVERLESKPLQTLQYEQLQTTNCVKVIELQTP